MSGRKGRLPEALTCAAFRPKSTALPNVKCQSFVEQAFANRKIQVGAVNIEYAT